MKQRAYEPFPKWAGGKRPFLDERVPRVPRAWRRNIEPFVGGGALFFAVQPKSALWSDAHVELINAYRILRDAP